MLKAHYKKYTLHIKSPAGTSRGVMHEKPSWFIILERDDACASGIGECGLLPGLSPDDRDDFELKLNEVCTNINHYAHHPETLENWPSIRFGLEMALIDIFAYRSRELFPSPFTQGYEGIPINGLIWMGNEASMMQQLEKKLAEGFSCIKLKIGAIDWDAELRLLQAIRRQYSAGDVEIRVDANGAFAPGDAASKLDRLARLDVHSIEQPIAVNQPEAMYALCQNHPLPVALDEELIGVFDYNKKKKLLEAIQPQYIILKPSLLGGFKAAKEWIELAEINNAGWWITSALEANIGLNAIAQWTYTLNNSMPQGLGTGQLYTNNLPSPLHISKGKIWHIPQQEWDIRMLYATKH